MRIAAVLAMWGDTGDDDEAQYLEKCNTPASVMRSQKVRSRVFRQGRPATATRPASLMSRHTARFRLVSWLLWDSAAIPVSAQQIDAADQGIVCCAKLSCL